MVFLTRCCLILLINPESIGTIGKTHGVKESNSPKPINKIIFAKILFEISFLYIFSDSEIFFSFDILITFYIT